MKRLTLENHSELEPFITLAGYEEYNSNIVSMLMWKHQYEIYFETDEHFAIVLSQSKSGSVWMMPYCKEEAIQGAIEKMKAYSETYEIPFVIYEIIPKFQKMLDQFVPNSFYYENDRDLDDYVYLCEQHRTLQGKKMQKRRNHLNSFMKEYAGRYEIKPLVKEARGDIEQLLDEWQAEQEEDSSINEERIGIHYLLDHIEELPIFGICIYIDGKLEAFCIQSMLSKQMMQCHVEKANRSIRGLYVAIVTFSLQSLPKEVIYFNREDDMGLEGLRKAKEDMKPAYRVHRMIAYPGEVEIRKATILDLAQIKELWRTSFQDETQKSSSFFFRYLFHMDETYVLVYNNIVISMVQARSVELYMNGQQASASFIVGVATRKNNRECGYMDKLLRHVLHLLQEQSCVILQAYHWAIYRPYGFELLYHQEEVLFEIEQTEALGSFYSAKNADELLRIYNQSMEGLNGYRVRNIKYYRDYLLPYAKNEGQEIRIHQDEEEVNGYYIYDRTTDTIVEWMSTSQEASDQMLSCLRESVNIRFPHNRKIKGKQQHKVDEMMIRNQTKEELIEPLWIHEVL